MRMIMALTVVAAAGFAGAALAQGATGVGPSGVTNRDRAVVNRERSTTGRSTPPVVTGDPNGTAAGPTTLSGTGPSTYGGANPGAVR